MHEFPALGSILEDAGSVLDDQEVIQDSILKSGSDQESLLGHPEPIQNHPK